MMNRLTNFKLLTAAAAVIATLSFAGCGSDSGSGSTGFDFSTPDPDAPMTFFVTSEGPGDGGNLGGLVGADIHCTDLAEAAGSSGEVWRAYLSTTGADGENASERIGTGPWVNALGFTVATSVDNLLSDNNNITLNTAVTENGDLVMGLGETPNRHDILTGTELNGLASTSATDTTCGNWTNNNNGFAIVGHHDRVGGGANPTSWSTAHSTSGCSPASFQEFGGDGLYYCFAM